LSVKSNPTIALTGATGFLGSHLMASLLSSGFKIIVLGRPAEEETLQERISKLLRWFGAQKFASQLKIVEIDLLKPMMGIPIADYRKLCAITEKIIHCASDTSFSEHRRDRIFKSNVNSLTSILEFAVNSNVIFFHYLSTAYVAGANVKVCREGISSTTGFLNVYEESKAKAEITIFDFCKKNSIPFTIIRPSIVYGDSRTGRSLRFNALYIPIQALQHIKEIYLNDINNHGGKKSKQFGIFIDKDGYLFIPLRIILPKKGALNLIPVDYFVNATMRIICKACAGGIYHVTNNSYTKLETISTYIEQLMKIKGVEIIYGKTADLVLRNPAEELFDRFIVPYRHYLSDNRIFDRANTDILTDNFYPPKFTFEIFKNCMEYAMSVNWGKSVFAEERHN
jgi:nucleoside-diphosphate-sugar epimerase